MRQISYLLLVVAVAGFGCTSPSFLRNDPPPPVEMIKPPPAPPIVLPDSVNDKNANDCARSLREEMDYDADRKPAPAAGPDQKN